MEDTNLLSQYAEAVLKDFKDLGIEIERTKATALALSEMTADPTHRILAQRTVPALFDELFARFNSIEKSLKEDIVDRIAEYNKLFLDQEFPGLLVRNIS